MSQPETEMQAGARMVPPGPVPTIINTDLAQDDRGNTVVVLTFSHPAGMNVFFISQAVARKIGEDLTQKGAERKLTIAQQPSGLILPS